MAPHNRRDCRDTLLYVAWSESQAHETAKPRMYRRIEINHRSSRIPDVGIDVVDLNVTDF